MAEFREAPFGHEPPGVATRRVIGVVVGMGVLVPIALVAMYLALTYWIMPNYVQLHTQPAVVPPAPRLQPHPDHDLAALREEKRTLLHGYMWTDKSHRFARIPIERAMQIYVEEQPQGAGSRERGVGKGRGPRSDASAPESERRATGDRGHEAGTPAGASSAGRHP